MPRSNTRSRLMVLMIILLTSVPMSAQAALKLSGFVDAGYLYENAQDSNTFRVNQVELDIDADLQPWASMRIDINFAAESSGAEIQADIFDELTADEVVEQAYITLQLPTQAYGFESSFNIGKFTDIAPTPAWELVEPMDLFQVSLANITLFAVPVSVTGASVAINLPPATSIVLFVANGWDNATDNNKMKTFGGRADFSLFKGAAAHVAVIYGPEQDDNDDNYRLVVDAGLTIEAIPRLVIGAEFLYGHEEQVPEIQGLDATWMGGLLTLNYTFTDLFALTFRFDVLDDPDGARFPPDNLAVTSQRRYGFTLAPIFYLAENMRIILEVRYDKSTEDAFAEGDGRFTDKLFTAALEFTYTFSHELKLAAKSQ